VNTQLLSSRVRGWLEKPVTWTGCLCSVSLPALWLILFYSFVLHVWLSLGRWPAFGEELNAWPVQIHFTAVWGVGLALLFSLFPLPAFFIFTVPFRASRHWAVYFLCYAAGIGLAFIAMNFAPGPFLNWLYD
jgi:hypothetical protein